MIRSYLKRCCLRHLTYFHTATAPVCKKNYVALTFVEYSAEHVHVTNYLPDAQFNFSMHLSGNKTAT